MFGEDLEDAAAREAALWGALAYFLGPLGAVVVLLVRKDPSPRFHAVQSLLLTALLLLGGLLLEGLSLLPILGFLYGFLLKVFRLGVFGLWVFLMVQTLRGRRERLPFIGQWAEELTGGGGAEPS